jgi:hypothetical protein
MNLHHQERLTEVLLITAIPLFILISLLSIPNRYLYNCLYAQLCYR